jgi:hypothetical protein
LSLSLGLPLAAQQLAPDPVQIVRQAANAELAACRSDDSHWRYRDDQRQLGLISFVVETPQGTVKQPIAKDGHPLSSEDRANAQAEMQRFVLNRDAQQKQQRDAANDDKQAQELLTMLPDAFVWTVRSTAAGLISLDYRPNPNFRPPDMEARVMGAMSGQMVVDQAQHRIRTIQGHLTQDVTIGWGILGRLKAGGTFDVERRQVSPGKWQITATSVHIQGHALFFKTISENQDEVKSDFVEVPHTTTLEQAANLLQNMVDNAASPPTDSARASR